MAWFWRGERGESCREWMEGLEEVREEVWERGLGCLPCFERWCCCFFCWLSEQKKGERGTKSLVEYAYDMLGMLMI